MPSIVVGRRGQQAGGVCSDVPSMHVREITVVDRGSSVEDVFTCCTVRQKDGPSVIVGCSLPSRSDLSSLTLEPPDSLLS